MITVVKARFIDGRTNGRHAQPSAQSPKAFYQLFDLAREKAQPAG